jgi:hypothetical protein
MRPKEPARMSKWPGYRKALSGTLSFICLCFSFNSALAEDWLQLTDAMVKRAIPVLKAQANELKQARDDLLRAQRKPKKGIEDPLGWLKQHSRYVLVPEGAVYSASCSRAVSSQGFNPLPSAVFTLGKEMDCCLKHLLAGSLKIDFRSLGDLCINLSPECRKDRDQADKRMKELQAFYRKKGFNDKYGGLGQLFHAPPDESLLVEVMNINVYHRSYFGHPYTGLDEQGIEACSNIPSGILIQITGDEQTPISETKNSVEETLKKSGMTTEEYERIMIAVGQAQIDSRDPSVFEVTTTFESSTAEERKGFAEYMKQLTARKRNAELYRKYSGELDPILQSISGE